MTKVKDIIKVIEADGWQYFKSTGGHHHFKHSTKKGKVTVPGKGTDDLHPKTASSILRQAGLK